MGIFGCVLRLVLLISLFTGQGRSQAAPEEALHQLLWMTSAKSKVFCQQTPRDHGLHPTEDPPIGHTNVFPTSVMERNISPELAQFFSILSLFLSSVHEMKAESNSKVFNKVRVSNAKVNSLSTRIEAIKSTGELACAALSPRYSWSRLMCYKDQMCYFSDIPVAANQQDEDYGAMECYTSLHKECVWGNKYITQENEYLLLDCKKYQCKNGTYHEVTAPVGGSFVMGKDVGCIFLVNKAMNWYDSRTNCQSMGAELYYITDDSHLDHFRHYVKAHGLPDNWYWIGIYDGRWLDGTTVASQHWAPAEPNDPCGAINKIYDNSYLHGGVCSRSLHYSICRFL